MLRWLGLVAVIGGIWLAPPAHAQWDPVTAAELYARSQQRGHDQASNPEYLRRLADYADEHAAGFRDRENPVRPQDVDPFRLDWRGEEIAVSIRNRYGARLHATLLLPPDHAGRRPAVLVVPGGNGTEHANRGLSQGLADAGYVVLGLSAQGDAGSQHAAPDPLPATPENEYCRPHDFGGWQQPQEMGIVELGTCAGEDPVDEDPTAYPLEVAALISSHGEDTTALEAYYERVRPRKTFAVLDAVAWLLSAANPHRDRVHAGRIGVMGHSLGAHAALLAGNGDPERRFGAVVSLDGYGRLGATADPAVPTLFEHAEGQDFGPFLRAPAKDLPGHADAERFVADKVPTGVVVLAGSSHQEWNYIPFPLQQAPVGLNASRDGERVGLHYALAWFDRFLGTGQRRRSAKRRLLAPRYDGRVDRSSIGQGPYDPVTQRNVPPTIAGESARHHLSPLYRSWLRFGKVACSDLRAGC